LRCRICWRRAEKPNKWSMTRQKIQCYDHCNLQTLRVSRSRQFGSGKLRASKWIPRSKYYS
jgi:hypothetical protein